MCVIYLDNNVNACKVFILDNPLGKTHNALEQQRYDGMNFVWNEFKLNEKL